MSVSFRMTRCDLSAVRARQAPARQAALGIVAATVLADATPKVPMSMVSRGTNLRASGRARPMADGTAEVEWGGDGKTSRYARAQHRGTNGIVVFRSYTTPGTGPRWFEAARDERGDAWRRMFAQEYARRLHG